MSSFLHYPKLQGKALRIAKGLKHPLLNSLLAVVGSELLYGTLHLIFAFPNPSIGFTMAGLIPALVGVPLSYLFFGLINTIEEKNERLEHAHQQIARKNEAITASITYAKGIQESMLPPSDTVSRWLPHHFVLYRPRDIVSGDFYWFTPLPDEEHVIITVVDCTGHGVPGALMAVTGHNLLNDIVLRQLITEPASILSHLNEGVQWVLQQQASENQDGMDLALCKLHLPTRKLTFAGANNPLWYQAGETLTVLNSTPRPIGGQQYDSAPDFEQHRVTLEPGASFYLFSDGYQDQFGGPRGKKFMRKRFRELLCEIQDRPMDEQKKTLHQTINDWMNQNDEEQVDDICIVGVKIAEASS